jgi:hypothetical protein
MKDTTGYTRGKYRRVIILKTGERELVYIYVYGMREN